MERSAIAPLQGGWGRGKWLGGGGANGPAVRELHAHVFEVGVAHVVDGEDVQVGVLGDAGLDVGVRLEGELFALLGHFREVHHFGALGSRHGGGGGGGGGGEGWAEYFAVNFL